MDNVIVLQEAEAILEDLSPSPLQLFGYAVVSVKTCSKSF